MYILFDIGGTKTRIASALSPDNFNDPVILDTPKNYDEGISLVKGTILTLSAGHPLQGIIGGIAGPYNEETSMLVASPNLGDWVGRPVKGDLEEAFHTKVFIENDSALVGLGEANFGAGKDFGIVAYITISTGVGGVRIVGGKIDKHAVGFEPGHQIIDADKTLVPDAEGNDLEHLISGRWVEKRMNKKPQEIEDPLFWDNLAKILAYGLNNVIVQWSPDVVVLGGSMMNRVGIPLEATEKYLHDTLKIFPQIPPLKKATLGDLGGLYGGLAIMKELVNKKDA